MTSYIEITLICEYCNNAFTARTTRTTRTRYCSHKCNQKHYMVRK